jgi:hypothetical protein
MWGRINVRLHKIQEIANTKWNKLSQKDIELKDLWSVVREIEYFAYLIVWFSIISIFNQTGDQLTCR